MKNFLIWCAAALLLMLGGPWLTVMFAGTNGMAVCFLLFFAVNPLFAVFCGFCAGKDIRYLWLLPFVTAAAFLAGTWLLFDAGELSFLLYGGCYLLLGTVSMLIRAFILLGMRSNHTD